MLALRWTREFEIGAPFAALAWQIRCVQSFRPSVGWRLEVDPLLT